MRIFNYLFSLSIMFLLGLNALQASDLVAGFISAKQTNGFEYEITVTTWHNATHQEFKRCAVDLVLFHDSIATSEVIINVPRVNGPDQTYAPYCPLPNPKAGETVRGFVRKNIYKTTYTFAGPGTARIVYQSIGREFNLMNIQRPDLTNFITEVSFTIFEAGTNNSTPELAKDLLVPASAGNVMTFADYITSPDADVQTFNQRTPSAVTNYKLPNDPSFGGGSYTLDITTGNLEWDSPSTPGLYLASMEIKDIRNAMEIGYQYMDYVVEMDRAVGISESLVSRLEVGPNPVRDELQVGLELLQGADLHIELLDMTGRKVQDLVQEQVLSGQYVKSFNLNSQLADGMYILRLHVNGETESRKLMLRK